MSRAPDSNYLRRILATLRILKKEPWSTPHEVQAALEEHGIEENIGTVRYRLTHMKREGFTRARPRRHVAGRPPQEHRLSTDFGGLSDSAENPEN